jgi:hypothetical protein
MVCRSMSICYPDWARPFAKIILHVHLRQICVKKKHTILPGNVAQFVSSVVRPPLLQEVSHHGSPRGVFLSARMLFLSDNVEQKAKDGCDSSKRKRRLAATRLTLCDAVFTAQAQKECQSISCASNSVRELESTMRSLAATWRPAISSAHRKRRSHFAHAHSKRMCESKSRQSSCTTKSRFQGGHGEYPIALRSHTSGTRRNIRARKVAS